jgi:hypothetical protein
MHSLGKWDHWGKNFRKRNGVKEDSFEKVFILYDVRQDLCSALAALVSPVQKICFLAVHFFNSCVPIAQQAGQAAVLGRLSFNMCLRRIL